MDSVMDSGPDHKPLRVTLMGPLMKADPFSKLEHKAAVLAKNEEEKPLVARLQAPHWPALWPDYRPLTG